MTGTNVQANDEAVEKGFRLAWRTSVLDHTGPEPKVFAIDARIGYQTFMAWTELEGLAWPSMCKFMRILPRLKNLSVLEYLASLAGCGVFRLPKAGQVASREKLGTCIKEFGEFIVEASGPLTPERRARIQKEGYEAMVLIRALMEQAASGDDDTGAPPQTLYAIGGAR
jgi:hypothetical protein